MKYGFANSDHIKFPPMVIVSIVNVCNLTCQHCYWPKLAKQSDYRGNMMKWDHWVKIIDEMSTHSVSVLNLGTDGEPLMHKDFIRMMKYARKKKYLPNKYYYQWNFIKGCNGKYHYRGKFARYN